MVLSRELDVARAGHEIREDPSARDRQHALSLDVDHQCGCSDPLRCVAGVESEHALDLVGKVARTRRHPLEPAEPPSRRRVLQLARDEPVEEIVGVLRPPVDEGVEHGDRLVQRPQWRVARLDPVRDAIEIAQRGGRVGQDDPIDPFGMLRGEELAHDAALGEAEQVGAVPAQLVHDRHDVADPLLERRHVLGPVGEPDATLVEVART